jgi:predicted SAM-dependent methyltransferase
MSSIGIATSTANGLGLRFVVRQFGLTLSELRVLFRDLRGRLGARAYRGRRGLKLNIGCGPNQKRDWVNIDLFAGGALPLDLRKPLPFDDASCTLFYSEHFFEHLDYPDDALAFLGEAFRVLQPGGVISTGVPNAGARLWLYVNDTPEGRRQIQRHPWHTEWVETHMEQVNFLFRQNYRYHFHEHRMAYDFETLEKCLRRAGFTDVRMREPDLTLDDPKRAASTLYVDATKPA